MFIAKLQELITVHCENYYLVEILRLNNQISS